MAPSNRVQYSQGMWSSRTGSQKQGCCPGNVDGRSLSILSGVSPSPAVQTLKLPRSSTAWPKKSCHECETRPSALAASLQFERLGFCRALLNSLSWSSTYFAYLFFAFSALPHGATL